MSTKPSTSTSSPSEEMSSVDMSQSHRRSQMTRIWEWGVDETLWNPDKVTRRAYFPFMLLTFADPVRRSSPYFRSI